MIQKLALIGFGEAGATFACGARWGESARAFDVDRSCRSAIAEAGLLFADDAQAALADAPLILSLVTADQALAAAKEYASLLMPGAIWCDMNSVAPETKRAAAAAIEATGGRYVDVAVLSPVQPAAMDVPLLLSGSAAQEAEMALRAVGFTNIRTCGDEVGRASAVKMIRSIMIKGIEALSDEMMVAAEAAGIVDEVLASLDASEKRIGWAERTAYNRERMATHGERRAAEMEEVAKTLTALKVAPLMTEATVVRQRDAARSSDRKRDAA